MGEGVFVMGRSPICESSSPPLHTSNCTKSFERPIAQPLFLCLHIYIRNHMGDVKQSSVQLL